MKLWIDIYKKLPNFELNMRLTCEEEIIGILGASGSGKSMLLGCIAGLITPDKGKIILNDTVFFDSERKINLPPQARKVGFLFQNYALFPHMPVEENIGLGMQGISKEVKKKKVTTLIQRFHLTGMEKRYPSQLSGGQQQRVAIARAMAIEPEILLLDEPFSALDEYLKGQMLKEMSEALHAYKGVTLYVTHNMEEAYRLCDQVAVVNKGQVEIIGEKHAVFAQPLSVEVAKITGCKNMTPATRISSQKVMLPNWGISLNTLHIIEDEEGFVGIRAHHIQVARTHESHLNAQNLLPENTFLAWIADEMESPFHHTFYLKLGSRPSHPEDYHILCEVRKELRMELDGIQAPITISLPPEYIFYVNH